MTDQPDSERPERRPIEACAHCGAAEAPYAYLEDEHHYCLRCARRLLVVEKLEPIGKRADDLTRNDVLFREIPLPPDFDPPEVPSGSSDPDDEA